MIPTVVSYLFNGIDARDVPWLLVLILAMTHVAAPWLRNPFGKRRPVRRNVDKHAPVGVAPARES
jgi:hypothetical protein